MADVLWAPDSRADLLHGGPVQGLRARPARTCAALFLPYADTFLPVWSLWAVGTIVPFVELIAGGLLLVGWRTREALLALGTVLVVVTFGHLLHEPLYSFHEHVIPRFALLAVVLVLHEQHDVLSVDFALRSRARTVT